MLKSTIENVENEKYKLQPMNTHYLKRIEKTNLEEVYFCIEKSDVVSIEVLEAHISSLKKQSHWLVKTMWERHFRIVAMVYIKPQ